MSRLSGLDIYDSIALTQLSSLKGFKSRVKSSLHEVKCHMLIQVFGESTVGFSRILGESSPVRTSGNYVSIFKSSSSQVLGNSSLKSWLVQLTTNRIKQSL